MEEGLTRPGPGPGALSSRGTAPCRAPPDHRAPPRASRPRRRHSAARHPRRIRGSSSGDDPGVRARPTPSVDSTRQAARAPASSASGKEPARDLHQGSLTIDQRGQGNPGQLGHPGEQRLEIGSRRGAPRDERGRLRDGRRGLGHAALGGDTGAGSGRSGRRSGRAGARRPARDDPPRAAGSRCDAGARRPRRASASRRPTRTLVARSSTVLLTMPEISSTGVRPSVGCFLTKSQIW